MSDFYLGAPIDPATGEPVTSDRVLYDSKDLTTHGVIVGMTGSGKTGLGVIFLEEALRSGLPALILDPKGDMTNLALTFPDLAPEDFEPWIDPSSVPDDAGSIADAARSTAERWSNGLAAWGLSGDDIGELRERAGFTIYTPGSTAGVPLNVIGSLEAPDEPFDDDAEALRDEIQAFTAGLLGMVGIDADPVSSRESILIANLVEYAWRNGRSLGIDVLLGWIQRPPIRKLGVFDVDTFFPPDDRLDLAMKLNGLLASPGFATWMEGAPIDIESLFWDEEGKPQAAIIYIAHLSDEERQFVVTLVLSKLITWMRRQQGTGELRAMAYMDEVFGFVPPTANPPAKRPILTLLKQARAFGVGMLLSTQNPVDLDYKAMSNAGTWCIGRLQTERDKARIVEALSAASGDVDVAALSDQISGLSKRSFLLHNTHDDEPRVFTTRWAMSYLRGPLTTGQISSLMGDRRTPTISPADPAAAPEPEIASPSDAEVTIMPPVADGIPVFHLDPAASWAGSVGASDVPDHFEAAAVVRVRARYDDVRADIDYTAEWEAVLHPLCDDPSEAIEVDHDPRDMTVDPAVPAPYFLPDVRIDSKSYWRSLEAGFKERLHREGKIVIFKNPELKMYSRVGESRESFVERCGVSADERSDDAAAGLGRRYEKKLRRIQAAIDKAGARAQAASREANAGDFDMMAGAVFDLLSGRSRSRSLSTSMKTRRAAERRAAAASQKVEEKVDEYERLQSEFQREVADIVTAWDEKAGVIEEVVIGLEKNDIAVSDISLLWIPKA